MPWIGAGGGSGIGESGKLNSFKDGAAAQGGCKNWGGCFGSYEVHHSGGRAKALLFLCRFKCEFGSVVAVCFHACNLTCLCMSIQCNSLSFAFKKKTKSTISHIFIWPFHFPFPPTWDLRRKRAVAIFRNNKQRRSMQIISNNKNSENNKICPILYRD